MRFGADSFRFVSPVDTARPESPRLNDLGATELDGRLLRLLEGDGVEPGEFVDLAISGLPLPTAWTRVSRVVADWYVTLVVPGIVIVTLAVLLGLGVRRRRFALDVSPGADLDAQREALLQEVVWLEARRSAGDVSHRRYDAQRSELKRALVELELHQRLGSELEE